MVIEIYPFGVHHQNVIWQRHIPLFHMVARYEKKKITVSTLNLLKL